MVAKRKPRLKLRSVGPMSLVLPTAARWLRPRAASASLFNSKMGGLAHGPEEKRGFAGRVAGCSIAITATLPDKRLSLGRGVPPPELKREGPTRNRNSGTKTAHQTERPTEMSPIGNFASLGSGKGRLQILHSCLCS